MSYVKSCLLSTAYKIESRVKHLSSSLVPIQYKHSIPSASVFNYILLSLLNSESRFLLSRVGESESRLIHAYLSKINLRSSFLSNHLRTGPGFGPSSEFEKIAELYLNHLGKCHFLADWACIGQSALRRHILKNQANPFFYDIEYLNPLHLAFVYGINPCETWISGLASKRVLVVNPFAESFSTSTTRQISDFESSLLPDINADFIIPPVTFGSNQKGFSFLDNLERFITDLPQKMSHSSYDVALVACGGYGLPVAAHIYSSGIAQKVLHVGGALQLYFGVIGSRWLEPPYSDYYSNYKNLSKWCRPVPSEITKIASTVENGCYI